MSGVDKGGWDKFQKGFRKATGDDEDEKEKEKAKAGRGQASKVIYEKKKSASKLIFGEEKK